MISEHSKTRDTATYAVLHTVEGGIERIVYRPRQPRFRTPLLLQHGMWHGAWCWQPWQALLAEWGWESHAHSLPGHGRSPAQRPIRWCTLQYYYEFLSQEIQRQERPPVLIGHSMGGALTQWYLKYGPPLPAAVLAASWPSHTMLSRSIFMAIWRLDPLAFLLNTVTLSATPMMRSPRRAAACLITEGAIISPEELHARLGPESAWVLMQHLPPLWRPAAAAAPDAAALARRRRRRRLPRGGRAPIRRVLRGGVSGRGGRRPRPDAGALIR